MDRLVFDVASAISRGACEVQQDSLVMDFPFGLDMGYMILADGMGGHASGEIASNIVVTEMFAELKFKIAELAEHESQIPSILLNAANCANDCIGEFVSQNPASFGMGSTLIAPVIVRNRLYWISIGDSPLYLIRDGELRQLNEDHSLAADIDAMVKTGLITEEQGLNHPDRNCLKSVLFGSPIPKIDCPDRPLELKPDDILIASSDGLQSLSNAQIRELVGDNRGLSSHEIAQALLNAVENLKKCEQDNISISVIKACKPVVTDIEATNVTPIRGGFEGISAAAPTRVASAVTAR